MLERFGSTLRLCCVGNTQWLAYPSDELQGAYYCPAHRRDLYAAMADLLDGTPDHTRVRFINDRIGSGEYIAVSRDGDMIELRLLGFPDRETAWTKLANLYPAWYPNFRKGCGK